MISLLTTMGKVFNFKNTIMHKQHLFNYHTMHPLYIFIIELYYKLPLSSHIASQINNQIKL